MLLLFYHLFTYLLEKLMSYLRSPSLEILFHTQLKLKYSSEYCITQVLLVHWFYCWNITEDRGDDFTPKLITFSSRRMAGHHYLFMSTEAAKFECECN